MSWDCGAYARVALCLEDAALGHLAVVLVAEHAATTEADITPVDNLLFLEARRVVELGEDGRDREAHEVILWPGTDLVLRRHGVAVHRSGTIDHFVLDERDTSDRPDDLPLDGLHAQPKADAIALDVQLRKGMLPVVSIYVRIEEAR